MTSLLYGHLRPCLIVNLAVLALVRGVLAIAILLALLMIVTVLAAGGRRAQAAAPARASVAPFAIVLHVVIGAPSILL